jgi:hypothetical protein
MFLATWGRVYSKRRNSSADRALGGRACEGGLLQPSRRCADARCGKGGPQRLCKTKPLLKWSGSHPRQGLADSSAEVRLGAWGCAR